MAAECAKVYREKASGAKSDRVELAKVIRKLENGDVLVVCRLDRTVYARSPEDHRVAVRARRRLQVAQGYVGRHDQPHGRLMLTILCGLAEFERN
jgi:DNA invertase Pin-like site-specific DNA recombinase